MKPRKPCTIDGCCKPQASRGWCRMHYARWQRNGNPVAVHASPWRFGRMVQKQGQPA
jgi:hypothetical protein